MTVDLIGKRAGRSRPRSEIEELRTDHSALKLSEAARPGSNSLNRNRQSFDLGETALIDVKG
jgi:hypothetical protein